MRVLAFAITSLLCVTGTGAAQDAALEAPAIRIAVFSPQRAFVESGDGKSAMARLSALQEEKARAAEERRGRLHEQQEALSGAAAVLSDSARNARLKELERFELDVQRFIEDAQAEIMGVQRDLETAFLGRLAPAVGAVATARGLHLVLNLDADTVAWAVESLDITAEVVRHLNEHAPE